MVRGDLIKAGESDMNLNLKPESKCKYNAVSLGEVMLRLDSGEGRIRTARSFRAWEGGGEYNVVRGLRKCFKKDTAVITAFADNEVGMLMEDFICQGGVDTSLIKWMKTDGIGRICRNGINFHGGAGGIQVSRSLCTDWRCILLFIICGVSILYKRSKASFR